MFAGISPSQLRTYSTERLEMLRAELLGDMREVRNEHELGAYRKALRWLDTEIAERAS